MYTVENSQVATKQKAWKRIRVKMIIVSNSEGVAGNLHLGDRFSNKKIPRSEFNILNSQKCILWVVYLFWSRKKTLVACSWEC